MKNSFRPAGTFDQFKSFLKKSKTSNVELTLWQVKDEKRKIVKGKLLKAEFSKKENVISINLNTNSAFSQELPLYIYDEENGLLFKGDYKFCVNKQVTIVVHDNVFLKEKRGIIRFPFNYTEVKAGLKVEDHTISYQLRDVSEKGYSFYIGPSQIKVFREGLEVALKSIHGIELPRAINGKVVHCSSAKSPKGRKRQIVGIKFHRSSKLFAKIKDQLIPR